MTEGGRIVCFGELLLRLSPPRGELLLQHLHLDVSGGGAEANVAVSLAAFGDRASMVSLVPDNALGRAAVAELRKHGVDVSGIGVAAGRMGLYFLAPGAVVRPSEVIYDRAHSVFALAPADAFNWAEVLQGASWLHLSGVTPALGAGPAAVAIRAARAARAQGVRVSFDGNYRAKLWAAWDGDAPKILCELMETADIAFVDQRDIALMLKGAFADGDDGRRAAVAAAFGAFPNLKRIAATSRRRCDVADYELAAMLFTREREIVTRSVLLRHVVDRIGTGDAFAAGVLHGLLHEMDDVAALDVGLAAAALKHAIPGDFAFSTRAEIDQFLSGEIHDVKR